MYLYGRRKSQVDVYYLIYNHLEPLLEHGSA